MVRFASFVEVARACGWTRDGCTIDQARDALGGLSLQQMAEVAENTADIVFITAGLGDCIVPLAGWLTRERSLGKPAYGIRKVLLFTDANNLNTVRNIDAFRREKPSAMLRDILEVLQAAGFACTVKE